MNKLPKIYQNELDKKVNNNKKVFDSLKEEIRYLKDNNKKEELEVLNEKYSNMTISEKIKGLINQSSYIFNIPVSLVFTDREERCQIAGVVNNNIITMDNRIIKISDLKDIKILEK